jgi:cellulose synthase/poly-beta-1,6-N-acetylglucosamine synthase-like glycosyltransferase
MACLAEKHGLLDFMMSGVEELRLISYKDWPVTFLDTKHMASAGLYYTWYNDLVGCPFCNVVKGGWRPGDDPLERHKRLSPSCSFITQHVAEGV